jgi:hypothetical protein
VALELLSHGAEDSPVMRGLLVLVGSMLLCASVAGSATPPRTADRDGGNWLRPEPLLAQVAPIVPKSEPAGLLLLGCGFVIVSRQLRRKQ